MKRFAWVILSLGLSLVSFGFLLIVLSMPPAPPEWSREAAETDVVGIFYSCVVLTTWIFTWFSWKKTLRG